MAIFPKETKDQKQNDSAFQSLHTLKERWKDGTFGEIIDDWKWIFTYSAKYKGAIVFYTLLGIVSTSLGLVGSIVSKYLIDIITGHKVEKLALMIIILIGSSLISLAFTSIINRVSTRLSIYINNDIQADIFDKIIDADWLSMNQYTHGDVLNRFNSDVSTVASNAISWLPTIINAAYKFIATFCVIWYYNKVMALIAFISAPFIFIMSKFIIKKQREYRKKMREMSSKLMTFEVETFYNFDSIKSFGLSDLFGRRMRDWQGKYKGVALDYNKFSIWTNVFMSLMGLVVQMVAFLYCLWLLWTNTITYGVMTLFMTQRSNLSAALSNIIGIVPSFLESSVSAHRIRELVQLPKEEHIPESSELDSYIDQGFTVEMNDISFAYVEDDQVITDSAFIAQPGEIVALVGPSGEGKTTMIRLILGLIHPQEGSVLIKAADGNSIEANADSRHLFSYVPQGNTIISGTIAENLRMVKEDASDEEIIEALKVACAWSFVEKLPEGINSVVRERGRGLSEGQAQRIAIARAVLRDAPILLLDEATSALDVQTERDVLRNIIRERPNKTCIVTTHRPSVLNMCSRVYRVMETYVKELDEAEAGKMSMDF
ncbi:MAG: ABC transporter ATP-binding protein [Aeriscardovia sp.]|nr:ABC transporter ATP-binding protein [Aeriscardovia sp.]